MDATNGATTVVSFNRLLSMHALEILTNVVIRNIKTETSQENSNRKCQIPLVLETMNV